MHVGLHKFLRKLHHSHIPDEINIFIECAWCPNQFLEFNVVS